MPTTFRIADDDQQKILAVTMQKYHPQLAEAGVRVGMIFAISADGPAIKHAGYSALATMKPIALKDRLTKNYDAELLIDETEYLSLREEQQVALLDHELSHIGLILDKKGRWEQDDIGRPKLTSIPGNWNAGDGFDAVVQRHGENAVEYETLRRAMKRADQASGEGQSVDAA